jgi:beta-ureidopropionase / N-carbamoyl-L-amino-acid hydrolase
VELHVEQGRGLVDLGAPVAVATTILAHARWRLDFRGEGNHAGTTRMTDRRDPVVAAARAVLAARDRAADADSAGGGAVPAGGGAARATIGRAEFIPGGTNVIASRATLWLDCRADSGAALSALVADIAGAAREAAAAEGCSVSVTEESALGRVDFDEGLRVTIAGLLPGAPLLATGAGHDAGVLAALIPTAMLFVRNPSGVSHAPAEGASDEDCRAGAAALATVLRELW